MNDRSLPSRIWRGFLVFVVAVLMAAHLGAGWYFSGEILDRVFVPPAAAAAEPADAWVYADPAEAGLEVSDVQYMTPLGPMDAWVTEGTRSEWIIHIHGKGANRLEAVRSMAFLAEAGYHQMAITYRNDPGQPADPSGQYRYGVTEREDLAGAVDYALSQGADSIVLYGYSSGAAIATAYTVRQAMRSVDAIVMDSPNLDLVAAVRYGAEQEEVPILGTGVPPTVTPIAEFFASLRGDINWSSFDYVEDVRSLSMPVLVLHGTDDRTIPLEVSRRAADARPDLVRLVVFEGAGHVESWNIEPETYEQAVLSFLAE